MTTGQRRARAFENNSNARWVTMLGGGGGYDDDDDNKDDRSGSGLSIQQSNESWLLR